MGRNLLFGSYIWLVIYPIIAYSEIYNIVFGNQLNIYGSEGKKPDSDNCLKCIEIHNELPLQPMQLQESIDIPELAILELEGSENDLLSSYDFRWYPLRTTPETSASPLSTEESTTEEITTEEPTTEETTTEETTPEETTTEETTPEETTTEETTSEEPTTEETTTEESTTEESTTDETTTTISEKPTIFQYITRKTTTRAPMIYGCIEDCP